jgi:NDP-sugar pyrophosphorylase family protein
MGVPTVAELQSIILVGGKGTRLAERRKLIDKDTYPHLDPTVWGTVGPKGLARMTAALASGVVTRPMLEWHLGMHAADGHTQKATLALGFGGELIRAHLQRSYGDQFHGLELSYLLERHPAGTIAPLVQLHAAGMLPHTPVVYANGDNLLDVRMHASYLAGVAAAANAGLNLDLLVIDLIVFVPWRESGAFGTLDWGAESGRVRGFREKAPYQENPWMEQPDGQRVTPINSGISIINNPHALCAAYLQPEVVECSLALEAGGLDYASNERLVKYETLYENVAAAGNMVAVPANGYWSDLGTEEKLVEAESRLPLLGFAAALGAR